MSDSISPRVRGGTMSVHTPGPWERSSGLYSIESATGRTICIVRQEHLSVGDPARDEIRREDISNARLIAAAPDLLESCKELCEALTLCFRLMGSPAVDILAKFESELLTVGIKKDFDVRARAAIAKAEGRKL